jgi:hypothetical protein
MEIKDNLQGEEKADESGGLAEHDVSEYFPHIH